jgi:DeoR family glycerol-3-phosphate regulon repressor
MSEQMKPQDRQKALAARVAERGAASVEALAAEFAVSAETVRRDLARLAGAGLVQKVHGGARAPRLHEEGTFGERMAEDAAEKRAIAARLVRIISPGETLFIDTGTTTLACAEALAAVPRLTVITNSVRIARAMAAGEGARIVLLGGVYAPDNAETLGAATLRQIAEFRADRAIMAPAALDETGAMDADMDEADVARAMHANARETVIVAAGSKIGRSAAHRICRLGDIARVVTEPPPEGAFALALRAAGVEVH